MAPYFFITNEVRNTVFRTKSVANTIAYIMATINYTQNNGGSKMRDLTEFNKLEQYCKDNNIPYERIDRECPSFIGENIDQLDQHIIIIYKSEEDKKR